MRKALNVKAIEAFKPKVKRYEVHDLLCPGFSVRVYPTGRKVFTVKYRYGPKQRRLPLGVFPRLALADARAQAMEALRQVDDGIDPSVQRRQLNMRVEAICADFIRQYARPRNRSWQEAERIIKREFVAAHGQQDIRKITRSDILNLMDAAVERGSAYQANRIHSHLRKLFNWCLERGIIDASPVLGTRAPTREQARDRVLDDSEIKAVLTASAAASGPYAPFVPLLLATGQRRGEVSKMRWSEVDFAAKIWVIPAELSKNGKPHVVPLSDYALRIIGEIPRWADCDFVFTTTGRTPIRSFSKGLRHIHAGSKTADWRFHDLRRTAASGMARLGIAPHVVEKVLNHISGTISGVAAVYNRYGYDAEKREALDAWGHYLDKLMMPESLAA
ncbi:tyrosine-type recombinase/integrase [Novosphingobium mathurense]|uniref:Site-specific recombinase XerD n=1 Tax=Novosphingobium mathurense TaxID=428990 RepID=A0A1U6IHJ8_9SPHN|nr:site-specific integrase [Novosphingobium mathurense]SLK07498.1 Site-specific recombinase XerD [Novosphingobium mathurense]